MKNKLNFVLKCVAVAILARADSLITKALMKLVPQGEPTLQSIISTFDVASAQLANFESSQRKVAERNTAEMVRLENARREVTAAADRAARIKDRLTDLVS